MIGKIAKRESRGTLFGTFSLIGSTGILMINKLGGYLFSNVSHSWPFYIALMCFSGFTLLTLIMGLSKKLKI